MPNSEELYEQGLEIRKAVLGKEYVEQSLSKMTDFTEPFQRMTTEFCWGAVWGRPGLDRRTRSLLNLVMLTALNRTPELKMHVVGALRNGVSQEEIRETLVHTIPYCGIPAALEAFNTARAAIEAWDRETEEQERNVY
jgi:4-carboxymuconolactone decarboxylase